MREVRIACVILTLLILFVGINSAVIGIYARELRTSVEEVNVGNCTEAAKSFRSAAERFEKAERFISLTVSHDDLTNIEEGFAELIGAAEGGNTDELLKVKSRLSDALRHLGRLSGVNIDSIM